MGEASAGRPVLLFVINLALDLALLWFAARVARVRPRTWRLWAAALLGAALAVLPAPLRTAPGGAGWLLSGAAVLLVSALLVLLLVWPATWPQFVAVLGFLWAGLALAGGLLFFLAERRPDLFEAPSVVLIATGVGVAIGGVQLLWQAHRERAEVDDGLYELAVRFGDGQVVLVALLDSGNHLRTVLGRQPVAIVAVDRVGGLLPPEVLRAARGDPDALAELPAEWQARCQLAPYAAVGRTDALMLVVRPDGLAVRRRGCDAWAPVSGQIGLAAHPLDPEGRYAALLPGELAAAARPGRGRTGERGEEWPNAQVR